MIPSRCKNRLLAPALFVIITEYTFIRNSPNHLRCGSSQIKSSFSGEEAMYPEGVFKYCFTPVSGSSRIIPGNPVNIHRNPLES